MDVHEDPAQRPLKRLLYIAYHFPPLQGSTGIARTLSFARYLRDWNWDVTVLTVKPSAYSEIREQNYAFIPQHVRVVRTAAFDAARDFSLFGRYPGMLANPDKWQSWILFGTLAAWRIVRQWRPHAIVSTYPIASAHRIGYLTHRLSGLPWIADFRDPMAQPEHNFPSDPRIRRSFDRIEAQAFSRAARILVTTPGAARRYAERFPAYPRANLITLTNGFDPEMFSGLAPNAAPEALAGRPLRLLHSGLLYPEERDPLPLFAAIASLRDEGFLSADSVQFQFRASGQEARYAPHIAQLRLQSIVRFTPPIPYREAVAEMACADGLLILQAANCNDQIPAKLYEYLYTGRPVLNLTDPPGDTAQLVSGLGSPYIARLDSAAEIRTGLIRFIDDLRNDRGFVVPREQVTRFSRQTLTGDLARVLDEITRVDARAASH